ncbi:hypothetical protein GW17_00008240 [Ensete ventricosum]|nr:hypothetical protein GW17_00008240 [Ensete ventricosum]
MTDCGQPVGAAAACSAEPAKGAGCRAPVRGCRPRPALPLVGAAAPTARVVAPWQGDCQRTRATVTCAEATVAAAPKRVKEGLGNPLEKRMILPL